jgi:hypothetical protein
MIQRLSLGAAAVLTVAGGATFATAGPASAAGWGCSGNEVSDSPFSVTDGNNNVVSNVHLYYDGSTGRNCAVNVKTAQGGYGTSTYTAVTLESCNEDSPDSGRCSTYAISSDPAGGGPGSYSQYAGPVRVPGNGHCIKVTAWTTDPNGNTYSNAWGPFHC